VPRDVPHGASGAQQAVGGLLLSMALTSFLTGVTEPIEFTFMFLAPALYACTRSSRARDGDHGPAAEPLGFGFSAGSSTTR
jgi:PTS system N-acetylglucosamine-specific IIC component